MGGRLPGIRIIACLLFCALLGRGVAGAQTGGGALSGSLRDESGQPLPGVLVELRQVATNRTRATVTAADGVFLLPGLRPGDYRLTATLTGFVGSSVKEFGSPRATRFGWTSNLQSAASRNPSP